MSDKGEERIRLAASRSILFTRHALDQMNKPERLISLDEVREVVFTGVIVEDYPDDSRGASALIGGKPATGRYVHVVCSPKADYLAIITAYIPDPDEWDVEFRRRRK